MGKRTENEENLKRYQERLAELQKEGGLVASPNVSDDQLIQILTAEGQKLLKAEEVKPKAKKLTTQQTKLDDKLGLTSKNPYIRARVMVLQKYPAWRRAEIRTMEQNKDIDNKFYLDFVRDVATLGDELSHKK